MDSIEFVGKTLGPLFLYEPGAVEIDALSTALASLDVKAAAEEWPYADKVVAQEALATISARLKGGADGKMIEEYRRLFVGPKHKIAPPWGSVYTDRDCIVFGDSTVALRTWMRAKGLSRPCVAGEPEDHIGYLLLLMAYLAKMRSNLLDEFLEHHLLTWAFHFLEIVQAQSQDDFFCALAHLTESTLKGIQEERALSVASLRFFR